MLNGEAMLRKTQLLILGNPIAPSLLSWLDNHMFVASGRPNDLGPQEGSDPSAAPSWRLATATSRPASGPEKGRCSMRIDRMLEP